MLNSPCLPPSPHHRSEYQIQNGKLRVMLLYRTEKYDEIRKESNIIYIGSSNHHGNIWHMSRAGRGSTWEEVWISLSKWWPNIVIVSERLIVRQTKSQGVDSPETGPGGIHKPSTLPVSTYGSNTIILPDNNRCGRNGKSTKWSEKILPP